MAHKVYACRDVKADAFGSLIVCPTLGIAKRSFLEACRAQGSPMLQYPEDYMLYELGDYDMSTGSISGYKIPLLVMTAVEAIEVPFIGKMKSQQLVSGTVEAIA